MTGLRGTLLTAAAALAHTLAAPRMLELFAIINLTTAIGYALLALSLGLVWGVGGILSFGQTAFFGIGAYAYALAAINTGDTAGAVLVGVAAAAAAAAALGYVMFYGRVSDVYLGVITLTVTLILHAVLRRTSGPEYRIGDALLGGFNGIAAPPLALPGEAGAVLFGPSLFTAAMLALIAAYVLCGWLVATPFGRVCVAVRENEARAELLGYDARAHKLALFAAGAAVAGLGGVVFCNGVGRITPDVFALPNAALTIIWVIVGGRGTLIGPILAAFGLFYLTAALGGQSVVNTPLVLGALLIGFVLALPEGAVPAARALLARARRRRGEGA